MTALERIEPGDGPGGPIGPGSPVTGSGLPRPTRQGAPLRRLWGWVASVLVQTFVEPVHQGRLRDTGWSPGLRSAVIIGYAAIALGAVVVLLAGPARELLPLSQFEGVTLPRATVWPLLVLVSVALTLFLMACIHGPAWLTVLGVVIAIPGMGGMALLNLTSGGRVGIELVITAAAILATMTLALVWRRGPVRRHEFAVLFGLLQLIVVMVAVQGRQVALPLGYDLLPPMLGLQVGLLAAIALPLAYAAGTAPAEVTATLARRAAAMTSRWSTGRALRIVLAVAVAAQLVAAGWAVTTLDPIVQGWSVWVGTTAFLLLIAALCRVLLGLSPRAVETDEVAETGSSLGWVAGGALVGLAVPLVALLVVLTALAGTIPGLGEATASVDQDLGVQIVRGVIAVIGLAVAVRAARTGLTTRAVVIGVGSLTLLPPLVARSLGGQLIYPDPTMMTIIMTVVVAVVAVGSLARRGLTAPRCVALLTITVLLLLLPHRSSLAEPLDLLLGSSAGLILLGLVWQLLTASSVGNRHGGRIPVTCRVLLIMSSVLITVVVLAYNALLRNPSLGGLELVLGLADQTLGVAILAGVVVGCLSDLAADRSPAH